MQSGPCALCLGLQLSSLTGMPLDVFTQVEKGQLKKYEQVIEKENLQEDVASQVNQWYKFEKGKFEENLYTVPNDALVLLGAYGHGRIRDIFFGSKMETIQSTVTNNLLISGPSYTATF